jgi:hypothetical protein
MVHPFEDPWQLEAIVDLVYFTQPRQVFFVVQAI